MPVQNSRSTSPIKTLKGKFFIASFVMALLIISTGTVAIFVLRFSAEDNSLLADVHLKTMQDGQKLLEQCILIEHQIHLLLKGDRNEVNQSYSKILGLLDTVDRLVVNLGHSTSGAAILDLHQINQLFRNTVHITAGLRSQLLHSDLPQSDIDKKQLVLNQYRSKLEKQIETMIITSDELSSRINFDYLQKINQLVSETEKRQNLVLYFMLASLILMVFISQYFHRNTIARLHKISFYLRNQTIESTAISIPVHGDDEIAEMARALEKLLEDHNRLQQIQGLKRNEE